MTEGQIIILNQILIISMDSSAVYRYTVLSENQYLRFDRYTKSNIPLSNKMLKL